MRSAKVSRKTNETRVSVSLVLDGTGKNMIKTPIGFLNHMLEILAKHSLMDIEVEAQGDSRVDEHHIIEDLGIVIGQTLCKALGNKKGIRRYGTMILPMDEVLALVSIDLATRCAFAFNASFDREKLGDFPLELVYDFFYAISSEAKISLHIKLINKGRNDHHRIEAIFKAFAQALRKAATMDESMRDRIPSTKGVL